jgi:hypothetical protein
MGYEVIDGFISLLEDKFNNEGKNKFFPHQVFHTVLDEKISRLKKGEPSKLTKMVDSDSIKDNWNNTWERLFSSINVYDNYCILIVVDKIVKHWLLIIHTMWVRFSTWLKTWEIVPSTGVILLMSKILILNDKQTKSIVDTLPVGMLRNW